LILAYFSDAYLWFSMAAKLVPVGYGIKKLTIMLTIVDDLVSVDTLIEERLTTEPINEYVQSCDIVAFNKICKCRWLFCYNMRPHSGTFQSLCIRKCVDSCLHAVYSFYCRIEGSRWQWAQARFLRVWRSYKFYFVLNGAIILYFLFLFLLLKTEFTVVVSHSFAVLVKWVSTCFFGC